MRPFFFTTLKKAFIERVREDAPGRRHTKHNNRSFPRIDGEVERGKESMGGGERSQETSGREGKQAGIISKEKKGNRDRA